MDNVARLFDADARRAESDDRQARQEVGEVQAATAGRYTVAFGRERCEAARAASCLLEPSAGDRVIVARLGSGEAFVIAVLTREGTKARIAVPGDLEIAAPEGRVVVAAAAGIAMATPEDVSLVSGKLKVQAADGSVFVKRMAYVGAFLGAEIERVKALATTFDGVFERWSQRVKRAYRFVEELDQLKAESIDYKAEKTLSVHAENAVVTATELVKIDGEQIHLG